ncbi:MAG: hypothetical protein M2R45_00799 [Verrucomicrobia subdivision 3 bacterium]|nr:hypothetical protein [Limisphaerales bacterium]MCS1413096.1 hypothetical protein [Limisphaerales bacterium]
MNHLSKNRAPFRRALNAIQWIFISSLLLRSANAVDWEDHEGYRLARLTTPAESQPGFTTISPEKAGIRFRNDLADHRSLERRGLLSGSGVAAGDVDGDALPDLYFCGLDNHNQLYRNLSNWTFEEIPPTGGIDCNGTDATGAAFADMDGDGDLDLIVSALGNGTRLFTNDGQAHFTETTATAGIGSQLGSMSLAINDIDGDQDLDLYVANFRPTTIMDEASTRFSGRNINGIPTVTHINGQPTTLPQYTNRFIISPTRKILELGQVDQLFLNDGTGKFSLLSFTSGKFLDEDGQPLKEPPRDWGLAVQMRDFTGDGAPDIYVCNDLYTPDRIWINRGDGSFRAMANLALRNTSTFSMGSDFADIDRDGDLDFFVVDMLSPDHRKRHVQVAMSPPPPHPVGQFDHRLQILRNTLQLNRGDNTYAEISQLSGVEATDWSWGPIFLDVDLDGYEDILVTNGQLRDYQNIDHAMRMEAIRQERKISLAEFRELTSQYPNLSTPNIAYHNQGDLTFRDVSTAWGFDKHGISQGMALADLDNDGDLDIAQNNLNDLPTLLRNNASRPRTRVQLKGRPPNTRGIGAQIEVTGGPVRQSQEILSAGRYMSSDQPVRSFAAGSAEATLSISVTWRSGRVTTIKDIPANTLCEIQEPDRGQETKTTDHNSNISKPLFQGASSWLDHHHFDEPFNDLERQPLLPNRLSQAGPGLTWTDLNSDGWDDLVIGTGRGGTIAAFENQGGKAFRPRQNRITRQPSARDTTAILPWETSELLIGFSNYEDGSPAGNALTAFSWLKDSPRTILNSKPSSIGALSTADWDQDGDLDLFIAGRVLPGRYPVAVDSMLLKNHKGNLQIAHTFEELGLVTGSIFSDLTGDGRPELIVTREWNTLKVFTGNMDSPQDVTEQWRLDRLSGFWNGIEAGDFNNDGRMDLVASNWGHNHKYELAASQPLRLYYGDLNNDGQWDLVESYYHQLLDQELPVRSLRTVGLALPSIRQRLRTFQNYADKTILSIYGALLDSANSLSVNHLAHTVFLNQGQHFTAEPLPTLAQTTPAFGIAVADFDCDGNEDLFLCQNFFATAPGTHRYDAGRGLLLLGDGSGEFAPIPGHLSGISVYGEQRSTATADVNHDGRTDLVISQNGAATKLFLNQSPKQGLRIRLKGPRNNPNAIGSHLRLVSQTHSGPTRELHRGSGWLAVNSPCQVLARTANESEVWVRWPDGHETITPLPDEVSVITIDSSGQILP